MHDYEGKLLGEIDPRHVLLKMFIAYEDRAPIVRTQTLQFEPARRCDAEVAINGSCWNFALLAHSGLHEEESAEAAQLDMIVLSARVADELPPHLESWIKEWMRQKRNSKEALVVLLGVEMPGKAGSSFEVSISLREKPEKSGIDFFGNRKQLEVSMDWTTALTACRRR